MGLLCLDKFGKKKKAQEANRLVRRFNKLFTAECRAAGGPFYIFARFGPFAITDYSFFSFIHISHSSTK
jgi:hypothetical protein